MYQSIAAKIKRPDWQGKCPRYVKLDLLDRLLDGRFYDHLTHSFFDEESKENFGDPTLVPIADRRPSAQFRIPRMVARRCARKLFAGRNSPKIRHTDKTAQKNAQRIARTARLYRLMSEVVVRGSVGAVAVTFRVDKDEGKPPAVCFNIWPAKDCTPEFDDRGELAKLRVQYLVSGQSMVDMKAPGVEAEKRYWYVRDFLPDIDVTYIPVEVDEYNPVDGFHKDGQVFQVWDDEYVTCEHRMGFVQGHWFINLPGGDKPDGACTFEDAIPNAIDLDYSMSQLGRGVRYNATPQLVTIGEPTNNIRGPMYALEMAQGRKDEDGNTLMAGDAKLLEMTGTGIEAALKYCEAQRNFALEQIAVSRKDPERMRGPLSGKAMEYLDEDEVDLMNDLRSQYGEHGMLPLLRKIVRAEGDRSADLGALTLQWGRIFQPTMQEISQLIPSLVMAINPLGAAQKPGPEGAGEPPDPKPEFMLLTVEEARAYLKQAMDIDMLDEEMDEPIDSHDDPSDPSYGHAPPAIEQVDADGNAAPGPADGGTGTEPGPIGQAFGGNVNI